MHFSEFQPEKNIKFIYLFSIFQVKKRANVSGLKALAGLSTGGSRELRRLLQVRREPETGPQTPFIQHLFSPGGRKLKERKSKWIWTQLFDFLRVKRANSSCFHNQLGWGNTWFHMSRRRTAHFISSWATERKKKDVRLWRLFQFPQRPRSSSTQQPWWSWSWWSWWCLELAVKEQRQLLELPAASTADLESADVWRTLPPLPQETQAAPFSPSLSLSFPGKTLKVAAAAQLTWVFPLRFFSPPSHKCFSTGTSCTNKWKVQQKTLIWRTNISLSLWEPEKNCTKKNTSVQFPTRLKKAASLKEKVLV